jgi:NAD-dependent deacetylase
MPTYKSIVVLTGAGISAESGIRTFRDHNGLWENHKLEDVCTPEGFVRNPKLVHQFYNARRAQLLDGVKPNPAHFALAEFERDFTGRFTLITQNVDNLHERAGSQNLIHMHGELLRVRCDHCQTILSWEQDSTTASICPHCNYQGKLRPHIVWFGEIPLFMEVIDAALSNCDLFVAIGTSGQVYPAAGFVQLANHVGARTVELNLEPSSGQSLFAECHYGPASELVKTFLHTL